MLLKKHLKNVFRSSFTEFNEPIAMSFLKSAILVDKSAICIPVAQANNWSFAVSNKENENSTIEQWS